MTLTTAQIITEYNAAATTLGLKTVKKFQDRKTAERRLQDIQGQLAQHEAAQRSQQLQPQAPDCNVTDAEYIALLECLNYDKLEDQLADNFSNGGHDEFKTALGWNDQAVAALIGSLEKKGLAWSDNEGVNGNKFNHVWLTEKGVHAAFYFKAQGRSEEVPAQAPAKEVPSFNVIRVKDGKKVVVKEKAEKAVRQPRQFSDDKTLPALVEFFKSTFGNDKNATMLREGLKKFPEATRVQFRHSAEAAGYNGLTARNLFDRVNKKG